MLRHSVHKSVSIPFMGKEFSAASLSPDTAPESACKECFWDVQIPPGTSLVGVQWLGLISLISGGMGLILGQGTKIFLLFSHEVLSHSL